MVLDDDDIDLRKIIRFVIDVNIILCRKRTQLLTIIFVSETLAITLRPRSTREGQGRSLDPRLDPQAASALRGGGGAY